MDAADDEFAFWLSRTGDLDLPFLLLLLLLSSEGLAPPIPPIPSIPLRATVASLTCLSSGILK